MSAQSYSTISPARSLGRVAKLVPWVLSTARAVSLDDATTSGVSPSRSIMSGTCAQVSSMSARCGSTFTRWCMLPMTGSCNDPGGSCGAFDLVRAILQTAAA
jgi:hypothetical protein